MVVTAMLSSGHISGNGGNGGNGIGGGLYNTGAVVVVNCTFSGCGAIGGTNGVGGSAHFPERMALPALAAAATLPRARAPSSCGTPSSRPVLPAPTPTTTSASRITDGGYNISSDASLNLSGTSLKNTDPEARFPGQQWRPDPDHGAAIQQSRP